MHFDERDLKPYAEPISASDLQEGSVYFTVTYLDEDLLIPRMETLVFVGRNLEAGDSGKLYFQDARSYRRGFRYDSDSEDENVVVRIALENSLNHFFEFERALDELMRCSFRRRNP